MRVWRRIADFWSRQWGPPPGQEGSHVERDRPCYTGKVTPTFAEMLGTLRLQMGEYEVYGESGEEAASPETVKTLLHKMSAVA